MTDAVEKVLNEPLERNNGIQKPIFQPIQCLTLDPLNTPFCDGRHSGIGRVPLA
jgi:CDGSH-type Zn-finger protein